MLVDLERNDLGRVSTYGTVEVDEFMVIERYSHVMHIVSNVRGEIAEGKTNADVIRAMFPWDNYRSAKDPHYGNY